MFNSHVCLRLGLVVRYPEKLTDCHWAVEIWPDIILNSPTLGAHVAVVFWVQEGRFQLGGCKQGNGGKVE